MSVNGKFEDITKSDLMLFAEKCEVPDARTIIRKVQTAVEAWPDFAQGAGVNTERVEEIARRIREVRLG
ncbi:hypothetical protein GCM10028800_14230 [Nesterenkonia populi]